MIDRRAFVRSGAMTLFGLGLVPSFLYRTALSLPASGRRKTLVMIFLRGGVDGLNVVVPFHEKDYYRSRPSISISPPSSKEGSCLDLDGRFGFHPALKPLRDLYKKGRLAVIEAVGSPDSTRSHFDAQDFMESAAPGDKSIGDGWLNRYLSVDGKPDATAFRGVSMGQMLPRSLQGDADTIAMGSVQGFDIRGGASTGLARGRYQTLYDQETDSLLSGTARDLFEAIEFLKKANPAQHRTAPGVQYPPGRLGRDLSELARLLKSGVGVEVAFVDVGGWDHHVNEGGANGQLANLVRQVGRAMSAFHLDLGDRMEDTVVLTVSEFGRTVRENGNGGTDHGHANLMLAMGGPVKGGKIYGRWPGLDRDRLFEGRDLALTTDFRDVFAEVLVRHLGTTRTEGVFPGFEVDPGRFKGFV